MDFGSALMENELHARDRVGVEDFVLLEDYTDRNAFIENLRKRFKENLIYVSLTTLLCFLCHSTNIYPITQTDIYRSSLGFG